MRASLMKPLALLVTLAAGAAFGVFFLEHRWGVSAEPPPPAVAPSTAAVDDEPTRSKIERMVAVPGVQRSELESAKVGRAYRSLSRLGLSGFDELVACVNDPRPVWPELSQQIAGPTTLGHVCVELITMHVDALYIKKEGLGFVTASNAREWWSRRREASLPDLQIEALAWYRDQRIAETESATVHPVRRRHLVDEVIPDLTRRIEAARGAHAEGRPLPIDRGPQSERPR